MVITALLFYYLLTISDLPSVFSGKGIAFIDPHEEYFRKEFHGTTLDEKTSAYLWHLERHRNKIAQLEHQFEPFKQDLFGVDETTFLRGDFNGTFFRFPLRTPRMSSRISATNYDMGKVEELIKSLEVDAHVILLFLKSLQRIEVYRKDDGKVTQLLDVRISISCLEEVRQQRKLFWTKIGHQLNWMQCEPLSTVYPVSVEVTRHHQDASKTDTRQWITSHYYAGSEDVSSRFRFNNIIGYLPSVGAAIPFDPGSDEGPPLWATKPSGQVFCFLPMPLENRSPTGLRVHVHAYFAIDQNRRNIKWPSAAEQDRSTDDSIAWNKFLVEMVLPKAMSNMITFLIHLFHSEQSVVNAQEDGEMQLLIKYGEDVAQSVYAVLPEIQTVTDNWKSVVKVFKKRVKTLKMFYSPVERGRWMLAADTIFENVETVDTTRRVILAFLRRNNRDIACVPNYILKLLPKKKKLVEAGMVCAALKNVQSGMTLSNGDRESLLNYIVNTFVNEGNLKRFADKLVGLQLLPLANGSWTTIESRRSDIRVYVVSSLFSRNLLPGLDRMLLNEDVASLACGELLRSS